VLVDSEGISAKTLVTSFAKLGVSLKQENLIERCRGIQFTKLVADFAEEYEVVLPDDFITEYRKLFTQSIAEEIQPIEGVKDVLEQLKYFPKAVVSNGPREKMEQTLGLCGLRDYFKDNIFSAFDNNCFKPDPRIYLNAAVKMGYKPEQCIVIDDGLVGVEAGVKAGIKTLYYNPLGVSCMLPAAIEFNAMNQLPRLVL
jgi:HAD superfamily hydrolase (TIGR01509 family)